MLMAFHSKLFFSPPICIEALAIIVEIEDDPALVTSASFQPKNFAFERLLVYFVYFSPQDLNKRNKPVLFINILSCSLHERIWRIGMNFTF